MKQTLYKFYFDTVLYFRDILQFGLVDGLHSKNHAYTKSITNALRNERFHQHKAKIKRATWKEILLELGAPRARSVRLPGAITQGEESRSGVPLGTREYYHALGTITQAVHPKTVFEFGTLTGVSALTFGMNTGKDCRIQTFDLPPFQPMLHGGSVSQSDRKFIEAGRAHIGCEFIGTTYAERIQQITGDSLTFDATKHARNVDLVLVDGGHSYKCIKADTDNALRILAPDGVLLWDDYYSWHADVVHYLEDFAETHNGWIRTVPNTNLVIYIAGRLP